MAVRFLKAIWTVWKGRVLGRWGPGEGTRANKLWFAWEGIASCAPHRGLLSGNEREKGRGFRGKVTPLISGRETVINVTGCRWTYYRGRLIRINADSQLARLVVFVGWQTCRRRQRFPPKITSFCSFFYQHPEKWILATWTRVGGSRSDLRPLHSSYFISGPVLNS